MIGSQAVHAWADLPMAATRSLELDVAPIFDDDGNKALLISGGLGEGSLFDDTHGMYAEGVSIDIFNAPEGWLGRARRLRYARTDGSDFWATCPDPHDICVAKAVAFRDRDEPYIAALIEAGIVQVDRLDELLMGVSGLSPRQQRKAGGVIARASDPQR